MTDDNDALSTKSHPIRMHSFNLQIHDYLNYEHWLPEEGLKGQISSVYNSRCQKEKKIT